MILFQSIHEGAESASRILQIMEAKAFVANRRMMNLPAGFESLR